MGIVNDDVEENPVHSVLSPELPDGAYLQIGDGGTRQGLQERQ